MEAAVSIYARSLFLYLMRLCIAKYEAKMGGTTEEQPFVPHTESICDERWKVFLYSITKLNVFLRGG